jgi:hypothetical protein
MSGILWISSTTIDDQLAPIQLEGNVRLVVLCELTFWAFNRDQSVFCLQLHAGRYLYWFSTNT